MYVVDSSIFASIVVKDEFYERARRFLTQHSGRELATIDIAFVEVANTLWKHVYVLKRIARRVQIGLARVGGYTSHGSGEVVVAFSTGYTIPHGGRDRVRVELLPDEELNPFFRGVAEAVEEAVLNSMFMSKTMVGRDGNTVPGIPVDEVVELVKRYGAV